VKSTSASAGNGNDAGIVGRWSDSSNYWRIGAHSKDDVFAITERYSATPTIRASASVTIDTSTFYTIVATFSAKTISATLDGSNNISYGSAALNETKTVFGIFVRNATDAIDDFKVEAL